MYTHFLAIKKKYDDFYRKLIKDGVLPMRTTEKGFWHASISHEVYEAFEKLGLKQSRHFLDLGSGDGSVVLIASLFGTRAVGVEHDPWLHQVAGKIQRELGKLPYVPSAVFYNEDYHQHPLHGYDTIFLSPDAPFYRGVENKLLKELNGRLIVYGNEFLPQRLKKKKEINVNGTSVGVYERT
ncbi:MAG: hypothetical protein ABIH34_01590 [Nanoarchaeota archaeon]